MAVAEPLWNVGSWEMAFLTGEAPWLFQVRPPAQAVLSSCLGSGKPESIAFPVEGGRAGHGGKGAWLRPFEFLRFRLDVLVRRAWVVNRWGWIQGRFGQSWWLVSSSWDCPHCTAASGSFLVGMVVPWQTETRWNTLSTGQPFPSLAASGEVPVDFH